MLTESKLCDYVAAQFNHFFPDETVKGRDLSPLVRAAIERSEHCFSRISGKGYGEKGRSVINHLHTDQFATFLYFLSNEAFKKAGCGSTAAKAYALNKALHSVDIFYEVELPPVFYLEHPVGTVLGRARYGNYLMVHQYCTVGSNVEDVYPVLGEGVALYPGSAVIGTSKIGDNCWLSYGSAVKDQEIPADSAVFGISPNAVIKGTKRSVVRDLFRAEAALA